MPNSLSNFIGSLDTLIAVIIGAFLATGGAVVAETLQARRLRKRREQDAARAFGEILATIDIALQMVLRSQTIGDRWGLQTIIIFDPVFESALWFKQNRDRLFDIEDMNLRTSINRHMHVFMTVLHMVESPVKRMKMLKLALRKDKSLSAKDKKTIGEEIKETATHADRWVKEVEFYLSKIREIYPELEKLAKTKFDTKLAVEKYINPEMIKDPVTIDGKPIPPLKAEGG